VHISLQPSWLNDGFTAGSKTRGRSQAFLLKFRWA